MAKPLILDLETKHSFRDFSEAYKLGISVVGIYDYGDNRFKSFLENELNQLYPLLEQASCIIGYNSNSFDLQVLKAYYPGDLSQFKTFDMLEDIRHILGKRLALNDIAKATLNKQKSGHGLQAIYYYKEKQFDKLKKYCLDDVALTKEIFEYGAEHQKIFYPDGAGRAVIKVNWRSYLTNLNGEKNINLTLPF